MKIQTSQVFLGSQQSSTRRQIQRTDLRAQDNPQPASNADNTNDEVTTPLLGTQVQLNIANRVDIQRQEMQRSANLARVTQMDTGTQVLLSHFNLLESISSIAIDQRIEISTASLAEPPSDFLVSNEIQIFRVNMLEQTDTLTTEALGSVITEDGRQIDFLMQLDFERTSIISQQEILQRQALNLTDPLVINLNGDAPSLANTTFEFDLDMDGETESLSRTSAGTGFIAFDKNQNGKIDDGSELFGPQTGSGFTELAQYDEDGNGWIDENDSVYSQLSFMDFTAEGEQRLRSLSDVEVGAIYLGSTNSQWNFEDDDGNFQAQMQRSGVALREDGKALSVQEIYYTAEMEKFNSGNNIETQSSNTNDESNPSFGDEEMERLDEVNSQVRSQHTEKDEYQPNYNPSNNQNDDTSSDSSHSTSEYTAPAQENHLRWLNDKALENEDDIQESKLSYLRDLVQGLRDMHEEKRQNEMKLGIYQDINNI